MAQFRPKRIKWFYFISVLHIIIPKSSDFNIFDGDIPSTGCIELHYNLIRRVNMVKVPVFKGSCTAIITPFTQSGIDYDRMDKLIDFQYENGTAAIVVCGTTGENATMTAYEHEELIDRVCSYNDGRMKIIAGVGSNDTEKALRFAKSAVHSGADGILMVTPYYNKTTQKGLYEHFTYVADRVDIPMIVYNVPSRTSIGISLETYIKLSKHPNINGVKEASGDFSLMAKTRAECGSDLHIWSGNDDNTVPMMALGALGVISVASNIVPAAVAKLCELCLADDFTAAQKLYFKYARLFSDLFIETNPIPVKTAMYHTGLDSGYLRLPLTTMSEINEEKLLQTMRDCGLAVQ